MKYFILGKIFLYELNAYRDAYLAKQLILHAKKEKQFSKLNPRLKELINTYPIEINKAHIVGLAYCQYLWNGFYDYMYARLFRLIFGFLIRKELILIDEAIIKQNQFQKTEYAYKEFENKKIMLLSPLIKFFSKKLFLSDWFVGRNNLSGLVYTNEDFALSMAHVQTQNILSNSKLSQALMMGADSRNIKIRMIHEVNAQLGNKKGFIKACAKTLNSASRWDRWFKAILSCVFGI